MRVNGSGAFLARLARLPFVYGLVLNVYDSNVAGGVIWCVFRSILRKNRSVNRSVLVNRFTKWLTGFGLRLGSVLVNNRSVKNG